MPIYQAQVTATSNTAAGTEDTFVEISAAASSACRIRRVLVSVETASQDTRSVILFKRVSAAGATGVAYTATRADAQMRTSSATTTVKNGATAMTVGTLVDTPRRVNLNGRAIYEWVPRNAAEEIVVVGANRFALTITCSAVSIVHGVTVEWED